MNELIDSFAIEFIANRLGNRILPLSDVFEFVQGSLLVESHLTAPSDSSGIEWISHEERERRADQGPPGFYTRYPSIGHIRRPAWFPQFQLSFTTSFHQHLSHLMERIHKAHRLRIPPTSTELLLASLKTEHYLFLRALKVKIATILIDRNPEVIVVD